MGHTRQVAGVGDFFTGRLGDVPYLVTRGTDGELHAFHNVGPLSITLSELRP